MKHRSRFLTYLVAALLAVPTLVGTKAASADGVGGNIGLYVIVYEEAIDRAEAEMYATGTNAWLRREGIPRQRANLELAAYASRPGKLTTGCSVFQALPRAITAKDIAAIARLQQDFDYVVPVVVAPNRDACWFAGQAFVGSPGMLLVTGWLRPSERLRVFRHELGHNLGMAHFSSASLKGERPQLWKPAGGFRGSEYGDPLSIMGHGTRLTFTDRLLLGSLPAAAGMLAHPWQDTYVLRAKGKKDRLLALPASNQVRVTLEYTPSRGVEARSLRNTGSVLWSAGGGGLRSGQKVMVGDVGVQVVSTGRTSAAVRVTWPRDTTGPVLQKGEWGRGPWEDFTRALRDWSGDWVPLTRVDAPPSLDHTTVPTYIDLKADENYQRGLLPAASDDGWVASATLVVNDEVVYQAVTGDRDLIPAGSIGDVNGQPVRVGFLQRIPLHRGSNTLSYTLMDAAGNTSAFHYVFEIQRIRR